MNKYFKMFSMFTALTLLGATSAFAEGAEAGAAGNGYAIAGLMALAAIGGTFGQSHAIASALESMGRNPAAAGKMQTAMLIGLAFIESLVILGFVVVFVKM